MAREFPLWVCVAFPWLIGLAAVLGARLGVRVLGARRAVLIAQYLGLGAVALCVLFCVQGIELLSIPDDPRALAHTPFPELLGATRVGDIEVSATLVGDRLSMVAVLVVAALAAVARVFLGGGAGLRDLGLSGDFGPRVWLTRDGEALARLDAELDGDPRTREAAVAALHGMGLLGVLEGAAMLVILAGNLAVGALGWALLGFGATLSVARSGGRGGGSLGDEVRASAASRVLALGVSSDLAVGAVAVALAVAGIGLEHTDLWAPEVGLTLYEKGPLNVPVAELLAGLLIAAVFLRMVALAWSGPSVSEAVLEAVLVPGAGIYLLLRHQRVLAFAPTVLGGTLVLGLILALVGAGVALLRPPSARESQHAALAGSEGRGRQGIAGTGLAWLGLVGVALGVGSWRTVAVLFVAQGIGRLGLRLAVLLPARDSELGEGLPLWVGRAVRTVCWGAAAIAPGVGFVALSQTLVDALARTSVLGSTVAWFAAFAVLAVAFVHAAAVARLWYEELGGDRSGGGHGGASGAGSPEAVDGLDLAPLLLLTLTSLGLGLVWMGSWFGFLDSPIAWLDQVLPVAGGHGAAPLGLRESFRVEMDLARPWRAGTAAVVAIITGFAWMWTRERFRRGDGRELAGAVRAAGLFLDGPRRVLAFVVLLLQGVAELAARGIGRAALEEGPRVALGLARDFGGGLALRSRRWGLVPRAMHRGVLGLLMGVLLMLGWLYAKPEVASLGPSDDYGFGGLRPKLIRSGGKDGGGSKSRGEAESRTESTQFEAPPGAARRGPDGGEQWPPPGSPQVEDPRPPQSGAGGGR